MFHICSSYVSECFWKIFFWSLFCSTFSACLLLVYLLLSLQKKLDVLCNFMAGRKILSNGPGAVRLAKDMTSYLKYIFYTGLFKVEHFLK